MGALRTLRASSVDADMLLSCVPRAQSQIRVLEMRECTGTSLDALLNALAACALSLEELVLEDALDATDLSGATRKVVVLPRLRMLRLRGLSAGVAEVLLDCLDIPACARLYL